MSAKLLPSDLGTELAEQVAARTVELATLSALAAELVQQLPLTELLDRALHLIVPLFGLDGGNVRLIDAHTDALVLVAHYGFSPEYIQQRSSVPLQDSVIGSVVRDNQPIVIERDLKSHIGLDGDLVPYQSLVSVPLRSGDQVLGTLSMLGLQQRNFTSQSVDLAQLIGNQIAVGVTNARLFEAQRRRIRELDAIGSIGKQISASFDFEEMLDVVYRELSAVTNASVFLLAICEPESYIITNAIFIEQEERIPLPWAGSQPVPGSITDWIIRQCRALLFQDLTVQRGQLAALGITPRPIGPKNPVRSWVGVPLLARNNAAMGVLALQDYAPYRYDEQTMEFLSQVASHISLGVQKVRLLHERERQLDENARLLVENARLYEESLNRVEQEMAIARRIQRHLFPRVLPQPAGVALDARCLPAHETGGDFYDVVQLNRGDGWQLGLIIGDASGKSISGAMLMAIARSTVRSEALDHQTPEVVMRETNNLIVQDVPPHSFVALCYATLDLAGRRLALANAGQLTPLRRRSSGQIEYLEVPGPRLPLGIFSDTPYAALEVELAPGDQLVFVTDGIVEARDPTGALFGFERLEALLEAHGNLAPPQLIELLLAEVTEFMAGAPQHDDMTVVALLIE